MLFFVSFFFFFQAEDGIRDVAVTGVQTCALPISSRVQVALATHAETRRYRINVEAQGDVVTLEGTTALERAVEVAQKVPGVREVRTQQVEIPPIPPFVA